MKESGGLYEEFLRTLSNIGPDLPDIEDTLVHEFLARNRLLCLMGVFSFLDQKVF